jgi:Zn-dependent protease with chaperone function
MSEGLRLEYEKYLDRYGLKPRMLPSRQVREASERSAVRIMYEEARSRDDPMAEVILTAYEERRKGDLAETRHPATVLVERAAAEVEATIHALPAFAGKFHDAVFVGEFPTGSVNCETVKVRGGFLVLVNSGTLTMLQQVVTFLWRGDADNPTSPESLLSADGVAEVLASYVKNRDPFYGPKPLVGGMLAMASGLMTAAATKFVVAHEYGHILAGHLAEPDHELLPLETEVGTIEVLQKNYAQELEADDIGYNLTLGVTASEDFDLAVIDAAYSDDRVLPEATRQKCLIAAPFVQLTIDVILSQFFDTARPVDNRPAVSSTHPPATERIERLLKQCPGKSPKHSGFINLPFMLLPSADRIVEAMNHRVLGNPDEAKEEVNDEVRDKSEEKWFDDIMRCVDALRAGDAPTAALALTDAFEGQRTILEPDSDVVLRELVRAALGQTPDIARTLLDRHRQRRAVEQYIESASNDPFLSSAGPLPNKPPSLTGLADLLPDEEPKGLGLVRTVLDEEVSRRENPAAEFYFVDAIISAWRGEREQTLSSFESALTAGVSDPDGRLARFVALEKRALELGVQLDIQKLLSTMGLRALGSDKRAARELALLINAYTEYLGVPLGPLAQRMIDVQLEGDA